MSAAAGCQSVLLANLTPGGEVFRRNTWEVDVGDYPFDGLKRDEQWNGIGSSAVVAPEGTWVLVVSNEGHGVVSGPKKFVSGFLEGLPVGDEDLAQLIERLFIGRLEKTEVDTRLLGMLTRLYGREAADRAVRHSGI